MVDMFWQDEFASWAHRFAAWLLDSIVFVVAFSITMVVVAMAAFDGEIHLEGMEMLGAIAAFALLWDVLWISGASGKPGHRAFGLRIRMVDGSRVPVQRAIVRWAVRSTNYVLIGVEAVASAFTIATTKRQQAVHDLAASTVAVRRAAVERVQAGLAQMAAAPRPGGASPSPIELGRPDSQQRGPFL